VIVKLEQDTVAPETMLVLERFRLEPEVPTVPIATTCVAVGGVLAPVFTIAQ
jgi:hypothetical protein